MLSRQQRTLARDLYIKDGQSVIDIMFSLNVPLKDVEEYIEEADLEDLRSAYAQQYQEAYDANDLLYAHEQTQEQLFRRIKCLVLRLNEDNYDQKALRSQIETLRTAVEAVTTLIDSHRKVRGIGPDAPSIADKKNKKGVKYTIVTPPTTTPHV